MTDWNFQLLNAVEWNEAAQVRAIIKDHPETVHTAKEDGLSPLMIAAHSGYEACLEELIKAGADINEQHEPSRNTALMYAIVNNHMGCVIQLIDAGADVDMPNKAGRSPLMNVASKGNLLSVRILLAADAKIELKDNEGKDALKWAENHSECADLIRAAAEGKRPTRDSVGLMSKPIVLRKEDKEVIQSLAGDFQEHLALKKMTASRQCTLLLDFIKRLEPIPYKTRIQIMKSIRALRESIGHEPAGPGEEKLLTDPIQSADLMELFKLMVEGKEHAEQCALLSFFIHNLTDLTDDVRIEARHIIDKEQKINFLHLKDNEWSR